MSDASWPPAMKEWVAKCLGQMTDTNRDEAQQELRQVISDAFTAKAMWTTDWGAITLKALQPIPTPRFDIAPSYNPGNGLKRKFTDHAPAQNKKNKKSSSASSLSKTSNNSSSSSLALDPNDYAALNRRAQRFQREHEIERKKALYGHANSNGNSRSYSSTRMSTPDDPEGDPNVPNWDRYTIVGTCQDLFKDYLRLTSEPKAEQIRPYEVLQQTLEALKRKWREKASYNWICSQFKSLRQDLTVQRIKNEFTVTVYEIHARMALEVADMVEYNQCQAMLKNLYDLGIAGKEEEFTAYRILMLIHGRNRSDLNLYVGQLTPKQRSSSAVQHALNVQRAMAMGNYHSLFDLYLNAPNMGAYIMDHFIERERVRALIIMSKAYMKLQLTFIQNELAFDTLAQAREFLEKNGISSWQNPNASDEDKVLDCKAAAAPLVQAFEENFRKVQIKGAV